RAWRRARRARRRRAPRRRRVRASRPRARRPTGPAGCRRRALPAPPGRSDVARARPGRPRAGTAARRRARSPSGHGPFLLLRAEFAERDSLVQAGLGREPEYALADRVAQDLLGAAGGLQARQERDHVRPVTVTERLGPEGVGD